MNQLGKVTMCAVGLALGSVVCAARVELGDTGLYITMPTDVVTRVKTENNNVFIMGKGNADLLVYIKLTLDPTFSSVDIFTPKFLKGLESKITHGAKNSGIEVDIISKENISLNGIKFRKYHIVGSNKIHSYMVSTVCKSSLISINLSSSTRNIGANSKRIDNIVGSISTKP